MDKLTDEELKSLQDLNSNVNTVLNNMGVLEIHKQAEIKKHEEVVGRFKILQDEMKVKYLGSTVHTQAGYLATGATALDA